MVHGNGPQVGNILIHEEGAASDKAPAMPLETAVAMSQGQIGYWLTQAINNAFIAHGRQAKVATVVSQVVVSESDPAFDNPDDKRSWPELRGRFAELFASRTRDEWCALLEGTDACFAPVLSPDEAADHPHMRAREIYTRTDGLLQASPAPRFSGTPADAPGPVPLPGEHTDRVLQEWGAGSDERAQRNLDYAD